MIKYESCCILTRKIGKLILTIEPTDPKIIKSLIQPLIKLSMIEDYITEELVLTISQYV